MKISEIEREFRVPLLSYFRRRLSKPHDAEDLVQDVLMKLAQRDAWNDVRAPRGYIFQVAANRMSDYFKREKSRRHDRHYDISELLSEARITHELVEEIEPERLLIGKDELAAVRASLAQLTGRQREILILYRIEGLKRKEIAVRLGVSVSMVEKHLAKAIACLALHLGARND